MLCLSAGALGATLALSSFTLAWTHSIEKIRWEEDWRVDGQVLMASEARVRGSGAGMEPPAGARLEDGVWHYVPALAPQERLRLTHSPYTADYEICASSGCRALSSYLPDLPEIAVVDIAPCPNSPPASASRTAP